MNLFKRSKSEQKTLLETNYTVTKIDSDKVHFYTDSEFLLNAIRKIDHLIYWTFQNSQSE